MVDTLLQVHPRLVATNFHYIPQEKDFQYDEIPMITMLSIATGNGDYEYDIIQDFRSKSKIPINVIIIDPIATIPKYERFTPYVYNLYVNPQQDGFSKLLSEEKGIPTKHFKKFNHLLMENLTRPDVVFGSNLQWGLRHWSTVVGRNPIQFDYRTSQFQSNLQGFKPNPNKPLWIKQKDGSIHSISQSALINLLTNRKIWRFYEKIKDPSSIPTLIISKTGADLFIQGIKNDGQIRSIHTFQDLLLFFASQQAI